MSLTSLSALASVSGFVKGNPSIDYYKVLGFSPELVADFGDEYYRANSSRTTFDGLLTHSRLSNATMVDSDGLIKWGPHNLLTYSEEFDNDAVWTKQSGTTVTANQTIAPDGTQTADLVQGNGTSGILLSGITIGISVPTNGNNTKAIWIKGVVGGETVRLKDPNQTVGTVVCSLTTSWQLFTLTETQTGGVAGLWVDDIPASGIYLWGAHLYRSDLGGMVNNPDRGDSYVPTTSSAVYLPRRGHHVYNGTSWVNEGLLHESEARTNLLPSSEFDNAYWTKFNATVTANAAVAPDGTSTAYEWEATSAIYASVYDTVTTVTSTTYTGSVYAKAGTVSTLGLEFRGSSSTPDTIFDLSTGTITSGSGTIEDAGNGWYRCSITKAAIDTTEIFIIGRGASGSIGDTIYLWGAQLEAGSTPSSYIPTSGATVNRTPDILTIPSANLPWPTPKVIGPELVTNGTFDTDSDWTKIGTTTIAGGVLTLDANGTLFGAKAYQNVGAVSGKVYLVEFDVNSITSICSVNLGGPGDNLRVFDFNSTGHKSGVVVATSSYLNVKAVFTGSTCEIDNISVREIDPLSVSIQMDGRMTYAETNTALEVIGFRWSKDASNFIMTYVSTHVGAIDYLDGTPSFQQVASNVYDTVIGPAGHYTPGTFVPYNIASRHGSTFINGAVDGTALSADNTPVALPDLSSTDLSLAYDYMGCIRQFRVWAADLGDSGIEEASEGEPSSYLIWDASADTYIQKVYD